MDRWSRFINSWMDQRRQFLSALVAVTLFVAWMGLAPILFPDFFPVKDPAKAKANQQAANPAAVEEGEAKAVAETAPASETPAPAVEEKLADFPEKQIIIGEAGFDGGYLLKAEIDSKGAGLRAVWLTDPRYTTEDRKAQLQLVGSDEQRNVGGKVVPLTFETSVAHIDQMLEEKGLSLTSENWEVVKQDASSVTLRYPSPKGDLEVLKTFTIPQVDTKTRDTNVAGYLMDISIEIRNLTAAGVETKYLLQGPVGIPLENADNSQIYREIKLGTLENPRYPEKVTSTSMLAAALVKAYDKSQQANGKAISDWRAPVHYAGIDEQFFAAFVLPQGNQMGKEDANGNPASLINATRPQLLYLNRKNTGHSNLSVQFESPSLKIPANGEIKNDYQAYFGPKRPALMNAIKAESTIQLGWFGAVAKLMLMILGFFHSTLQLPYALAIIALTIVVRSAMIPLSKKQAIEAEKMRIFAPKLKEIQERYKNQPEEFAKAYREFQRKHNYQPLMGCLPALIQLPIFLGLYSCLSHAVDLRLAKFLWIDNLAAPDALFALPFTVPFFGWTEFNLLPFVTVALFVVQQKLFTPPPTSDEQALQYKMMNYMMIFIGFAFYRVPAGLCVYFIASSLWGIAERLLLKKSIAKHQLAIAESAAETGIDAPAGNAKPEIIDAKVSDKPRAPTWWDKIREAADQANKATNAQTTQASQRKFSKDKGGKGPGSRR
ncbi:membrane protein insertase YidC [Planctomicrobium sp. SH668]|uniref:membrane protein insertase YidC n=1 Tax=Planctomicrobium sp. SH668 TaxID=3448126 RepID=UPI003F5B1B0A